MLLLLVYYIILCYVMLCYIILYYIIIIIIIIYHHLFISIQSNNLFICQSVNQPTNKSTSYCTTSGTFFPSEFSSSMGISGS